MDKTEIPTNDRLSLLESQVETLVGILAHFDKEPPALPESDAIKTRLGAVEGRADNFERRLNAHDGYGDALGTLAHRLSIVEQASGVAASLAPRDLEHEAAETEQAFKCAQCASESTRIVRTATTSGTQVPCPVCSGVMNLVGETPVVVS